MVFWKILSFFGSEEWYLLIMPALLWCVNARLGLRVGVMFLLSANLNGALKLFFHAPRPAWLDANIITFAYEPSFGFPSGHAQNAVAVWGLLAAKAKTRLAWATALILAVFIGLSRLALQVHFPGDVLGGWLIGVFLLGAFLNLEKPAGSWLKNLDFVQQIVLIGCVSLAAVILPAFSSYEIPELPNGTPSSWAIASKQGFVSLLKTAGAFFGFLIGACWMLKNGGYVDGGHKILRYIIGLIGVAFFWFGLGKILPRGEDILSLDSAQIPYAIARFYGFTYLRYALVGFWISAGAPLIFRRLESRPPTRPNRLHNS